jgi:hypothetical protein
MEDLTKLSDEELQIAADEGRAAREELNTRLHAIVNEQENRRIVNEVKSMDPRLVSALKSQIVEAEGIESQSDASVSE